MAVYSFTAKKFKFYSSMLIPILLLLLPLFSVLALFLRKRGVRFAYIWFLFLSIAFVMWILILTISPQGIKPFTIQNWFQLGIDSVHLTFEANNMNWLLVFSVLTMLLMYFLTGVSRLDLKMDLTRWIFMSALTTFSILSLLASNVWSVLLAWTILDVFYLIFRFVFWGGKNISFLIKSLIIRFLGSICLVWVTANYSPSGMDASLTALPPQSGLVLFLAAFFHSGVLPIELNQSEGKNTNDEILDWVFRIYLFITSFSVLANVPSIAVKLNFLSSIILKLAVSLLTVFFSYRWAVEKRFNASISFLLLAGTGTFFLLILNDEPQAIFYWLVFFLVGIVWLVFYTHRSKSLLIFPILLLFLISGLPFTLFSYGMRAIPFSDISLNWIPFFLTHVFCLIGFFNKMTQKHFEFEGMDSWYQAIYTIGLFIPLISLGAILVRNLGSFLEEISNWWMGVAAIVLMILGMIYFNKKESGPVLKRGENRLERFLSFLWFFKIINFFEARLHSLVIGFSGLLEGNGGMIWSFVIIILIISLIRIS